MRCSLLLVPFTLACLSAQALPEGWTAISKDVADQAALARTTSVSMAEQNTELGADSGDLLKRVDAAAGAAARIETEIYELSKLEQAQNVSEDARLDRLREEADRLVSLTDCERIVLGNHSTTRQFRTYAKAAAKQAARIEKDASTLTATGEHNAH